MKLRHVVTCFLERPTDGHVLLGRRSDQVSTYRAHWAGISGSVEEETPLHQAYREVEEETGLSAGQVELKATGWPIRFPDWELGTLWVVHPFLFACRAPEEVRHDWEHVRFEWISPGDIAEMDTVPKLHDAYLSVEQALRQGGSYESNSIFRMVQEDRTHGAAELGVWTLVGLKAALEEVEEQCESGAETLALLTQKCRRAADLRPSMAPPLSAALHAYRIFQCELSHKDQSLTENLESAHERLKTIIWERETAPLEAARAAADILQREACVVTLSYSSTVLATIQEAKREIERLVVAESRPACEGRLTARAAARMGVETELMTDAAAMSACSQADVVLLGADSVTADRRVFNKTGSMALCCVARRVKARTMIVTTMDKFLPNGREAGIETMPPDELGDPIEGVKMNNPYFEHVPGDMIDVLVAENGPVTEDARLDLHRRLNCVYNDIFRDSGHT